MADFNEAEQMKIVHMNKSALRVVRSKVAIRGQ